MDNATNSSSNGTYSGFTPPPPKNFWGGLLLPIAYIIILVGSLYSFSTVYRQRQAARASKLEPWFPPHVQRNIYLSLLHLDPSEAAEKSESEKKLSRVPDSVLKAALLKRAVEDIQRIVQLRQAKPALQTLLQRGSVGDELWQRFQRAEQEMELEVKDVVNEVRQQNRKKKKDLLTYLSQANAFATNWGQTIFQSANEMNQNILIKQRLTELKEKLEGEREWWDDRRQGIQSDFMKELEMDSDGKLGSLEAAKKNSSDDDAVLVEVGGPAGAQGAGGKKKGKGKK